MTYWNNMMDYDHPGFWGGISLLFIWSIIWKGLALWKSARNDERYWFVFLLLPINTAGIIEMLYLFVFAKNKLVLVSEPVRSGKKKTAKK
jgi:hypothetical protein